MITFPYRSISFLSLLVSFCVYALCCVSSFSNFFFKHPHQKLFIALQLLHYSHTELSIVLNMGSTSVVKQQTIKNKKTSIHLQNKVCQASASGVREQTYKWSAPSFLFQSILNECDLIHNPIFVLFFIAQMHSPPI